MKKTKIFNNFGLKVLALIFSIVLWLIVVNVSDPIISTQYNDIPLTVKGIDSITSQGKTYDLLGASTVSVTVNAKRSVLDSLSKDNINAYVDLATYNEETGMVSVSVESNKYNDRIESIKSKTDEVQVSIEDSMRKQFVITPVVSGNPEEGYVLGNVATEQNVVRISGAQSLVSAIDKVTAEVSISGLNTDVNTTVDLKLYDESDEPIKDASLAKNINTVAISVEILATKELELNLSYTGTPASGYAVAGAIEADRENVLVAGKPERLNNLFTLDIPGNAFDITGLSETATVAVDLARYLPDGVSLVNKENSALTMTLPLEPVETKILQLDKKNVEMISLDKSLRGEILGSMSYIEVEVMAISSVMKELKADAVKARIDWDAYMTDHGIAELRPGTYRLPLQLELPEGVSLLKELSVSIKLSEK